MMRIYKKKLLYAGLLLTIAYFSNVSLSFADGGNNGSNANSGSTAAIYSNQGNTTITSNSTSEKTIFPANSTLIPLAPQNIFNDPGTGANITGIPLIWYYMDAFGMMNCEGLSEPIVEKTDYVLISFQPDCAVNSRVEDVNLVNARPIVSYTADLEQDSYYQPLGVVMIQANWDKTDNVNLLTIIKSASNFLAKQVKGYDRILLVGDVLQRNISSQRATEGMSQGVTVTPSISSSLGRDGLTGSMFGYGRANGESHPVSRAGITLLVVAVTPGPWAGRKPQFTQVAYITRATALPQHIQRDATNESTDDKVKDVVKKDFISKNTDDSNKKVVDKAVTAGAKH